MKQAKIPGSGKLVANAARQSLRAFINGWLGVIGRLRAGNYDISRSIVIASSPRGGSTWLAEIIVTLPGYTPIMEPLEPAIHPQVLEHGFGWHAYVSPGSVDELKHSYLQQVLSGANLNLRYLGDWRNLRQVHPFRFRGYVIKFVRANLLLYWMLQEFPVKGILLIRHPCATVASQLHFGAWNHADKWARTFLPMLETYDPRLVPICESLQTTEQVLAFDWVMKTLVPLREPRPHPWLLTTYKRLMVDGDSELQRIFEHLGYSIPKQAYRQLHIDSSSTKSYGALDADSRLTRWRKLLTSQQIESILQIVADSGIDFYDHRPHPDYSALGLAEL